MKKAVFLFCIIGGAYACSTISSPVVSNASFDEWFALGSGCRAKHDIVGDVRKSEQAPDDRYPGYRHLRFTINELTLDGTNQVKAGRDFGRECAVRLKAVPSKGFRITDIVAETEWEISKPQAIELVAAAELKLGQTTLDQQAPKFSKDSNFQNKQQQFTLKSTAATRGTLNELMCNEPKIVGFDYTWIARTDYEKPKNLQIQLSGEKVLDIFIKLEECHDPGFKANTTEEKRA
jgi:hypothetical protein